MKYFFVLGKNTTLSLAEIVAVFPNVKNYELINREIFIFEHENINASNIIKKMGGVIKIGEVINEVNFIKEKFLALKLSSLIKKKEKSKIFFGFSLYGNIKINNRVLGMEIKKNLKEKKINSRWVISRETILSSVVVEQNKLLERGIEFILVSHNKKLIIGRTLAVQPFKDLSFRDYGRPGRDDYSGMLPPKLAQIMINLSLCPKTEILLDPFCGSGTVLTEAILTGFKNLIGSDISKKAIQDTKNNIDWTLSKFGISSFNFEIFNLNVNKLNTKIRNNSVSAIVTEPYLGPQRKINNYQQIIRELQRLYSESLREFYKILKPQKRIVMIWPIFRIESYDFRKTENIFLSLNFNNFKIINPIPLSLRCSKFVELTKRNTIIYGRDNQKIWREIVILEK